MKHPSGFTLIELVVAIAILAIIAGLAIPAYNGYIREARLGAMRTNLDSMRVALEDYRLDNGNYGPAGPYDTSGIATTYGWTPEGGAANYAYTVAPATVGSTVTYNAWVTDAGSSTWVRCDNRMATCCDGTGGTTSACP